MSAHPPRPSGSPWLIAALTIAAGVFAGLTAAAGGEPFTGLHPRPPQHLVGGQLRGAPLAAQALFTPPPRPVVTRTVDVYDPPPSVAPRPTAVPQVAAPPTPRPTPASTPTPVPGPTEPGDGEPDG
ncbi:MAG TPA: hypothetical protein VNG93_05440 [Candidatus Dormibacteraeota bacterium]|nr:hypothetical protein [Candidatus Dormibacteraeota bacterium]